MADDRAAEGLDHLQRAGMELIAAARAFLDVAEELVADRDRVAEVVSMVGSVAGDAMAAASRATGRPGPTGGGGDEPSVEHIDVT